MQVQLTKGRKALHGPKLDLLTRAGERPTHAILCGHCDRESVLPNIMFNSLDFIAVCRLM